MQNERQPIPDVPAVYFVRGSEEAVSAVTADAGKGLYDSMHLNFSPPLTPPLLEALAKQLVSSGSAHRVSKVPLPSPSCHPLTLYSHTALHLAPRTHLFTHTRSHDLVLYSCECSAGSCCIMRLSARLGIIDQLSTLHPLQHIGRR